MKMPIAIKVLREGVSANQNRELLDEARLMASVVNKYCVPLYGVCMTKEVYHTINGGFYIVHFHVQYMVKLLHTLLPQSNRPISCIYIMILFLNLSLRHLKKNMIIYKYKLTHHILPGTKILIYFVSNCQHYATSRDPQPKDYQTGAYIIMSTLPQYEIVRNNNK